MKNLIGQRFGKLTVIDQLAIENGTNKCECECDCGNSTIVRAGDLQSGRTRSCGCLRRKSGYTLQVKKFIKQWNSNV